MTDRAEANGAGKDVASIAAVGLVERPGIGDQHGWIISGRLQTARWVLAKSSRRDKAPQEAWAPSITHEHAHREREWKCEVSQHRTALLNVRRADRPAAFASTSCPAGKRTL